MSDLFVEFTTADSQDLDKLYIRKTKLTKQPKGSQIFNIFTIEYNFGGIIKIGKSYKSYFGHVGEHYSDLNQNLFGETKENFLEALKDLVLKFDTEIILIEKFYTESIVTTTTTAKSP
jgi:hypothetical protein